MRIISQDGKCDYPYENSTLFIDYMDGRVIKIVPSTGGYKGSNIATYSTEENAIKAIEMLRNEYKRNVQLSVCLNGIGTEIVHFNNNEENNQIAIDCRESLEKNAYFQFPKDDEVKV